MLYRQHSMILSVQFDVLTSVYSSVMVVIIDNVNMYFQYPKPSFMFLCSQYIPIPPLALLTIGIISVNAAFPLLELHINEIIKFFFYVGPLPFSVMF